METLIGSFFLSKSRLRVGEVKVDVVELVADKSLGVCSIHKDGVFIFGCLIRDREHQRSTFDFSLRTLPPEPDLTVIRRFELIGVDSVLDQKLVGRLLFDDLLIGRTLFCDVLLLGAGSKSEELDEPGLGSVRTN